MPNNIRDSDLEAANRCHLYLQVGTLADICVGSGDHMTEAAWLGQCPLVGVLHVLFQKSIRVVDITQALLVYLMSIIREMTRRNGVSYDVNS
jgi:hypothetical protein